MKETEKINCYLKRVNEKRTQSWFFLTEIAADLSTGYQLLVLAPRGLVILLFLKKHKI